MKEVKRGLLYRARVEQRPHRENDSEAETCSESEAENVVETVTTFIAKDNTVWQKNPPSQHQTAIHNIVRQRAGPHRSTDTLTISDTFKKIFPIEIINIIVRHTNKKASVMYEEYNAQNRGKTLTWTAVTSSEMYAFLGVLICAVANNSNTDHTTDMWKASSYPLYRATFGINRFWNIVRFIRFDDSNTREARIREDKAAPIPDIWNMLNSNLSSMYKPTEHLTIDEQLYPFRGRTKIHSVHPIKASQIWDKGMVDL